MSRVEKLERDNARLREALTTIAEWSRDTFPRVPCHDNPTDTVSYGVAYGSNGERDFMRKIARTALAPSAPAVERAQEIRATYADGLALGMAGGTEALARADALIAKHATPPTRTPAVADAAPAKCVCGRPAEHLDAFDDDTEPCCGQYKCCNEDRNGWRTEPLPAPSAATLEDARDACACGRILVFGNCAKCQRMCEDAHPNVPMGACETCGGTGTKSTEPLLAPVEVAVPKPCGCVEPGAGESAASLCAALGARAYATGMRCECACHAEAAMPEGGVNSAPTPPPTQCSECGASLGPLDGDDDAPFMCDACATKPDPAAEPVSHTGAMLAEDDAPPFDPEYDLPKGPVHHLVSIDEQAARDDATWNAAIEAADRAVIVLSLADVINREPVITKSAAGRAIRALKRPEGR